MIDDVAAPLPEPDHAARRGRVLEALGDSAALVLPPAPEIVLGRDTELPYRPDPNQRWLAGAAAPDTVLALVPDAEPGPFIVFTRPRDPDRERWTGARLDADDVADRLGADAVYTTDELHKRLPRLLSRVDTIHFPIRWGDDALDRIVLAALVRARRNRQRRGRGPNALVEPGALLDELRLVKDDAELARMRRAAGATRASFDEARDLVADGAGEWEVQAAVEAGFRSRTGEAPAFPTIAASGPNATVLHYVENSRRMRAGELLLLDAGASCDGYAADITRTWTVGGEPQGAAAEVHAIVAEANRAAIEAVAPGSGEDEPHRAALRVLLQGMHDLGLIQEAPDVALAASEARRDAPPNGGEDRPAQPYARYFPHRVSHWLGLEVHDVGNYEVDGAPRPLEPGMVLTVEPGLYVPSDDDEAPAALRGIGVRIEDDVLVTREGAEVLTRA